MPVLMLVSAILVWRKSYGEVPLFFTYVVSAWTIGIFRYIAFSMGRSAYFYVYWISELAGAVFVCLAFYEVLIRRLFPRFHRVRFYRNLFPIIAFVILFLTIITALQSADKQSAFLKASRALDFGRTATLVFFVALMAVMGREWSRRDFGITLGFGLQAAVALLTAALRTQSVQSSSLGTIELIAFNVTCLIWLITFWKREERPIPIRLDRITPETLEQARSWEKSVKDYLTTGKKLP